MNLALEKKLFTSNLCFLFRAGEYKVGIKFNDSHIPGSPFKVYISPQVGDAKKVEIGQFPDAITTLNKPVAFIVSKNGAKGTLDCKVWRKFNGFLVVSCFLIRGRNQNRAFFQR